MTENSKCSPEFANACKKFYANYESIASYDTNQVEGTERSVSLKICENHR